MSKEKYTAEEALARLDRNKIKISGKVIEVKDSNAGIKLLGYIDYLVNKCGYMVRFTK